MNSRNCSLTNIQSEFKQNKSKKHEEIKLPDKQKKHGCKMESFRIFLCKTIKYYGKRDNYL
jgi:hypothetical protein